MRHLLLHDHMNTTQEVMVNADDIQAVDAFGSGSAIQLENGIVVAVHETVKEVYAAICAK